MATATISVAMTMTTAPSASAATGSQSYDLTTDAYCTSATGQVTPALNQNLISNSAPTADSVTALSALYPDATRVAVSGTSYDNYVDGDGNVVLAGGPSVTDPGTTALPDCWLDTSSLAATDPANEIASATVPSYPGSLGGDGTGRSNLYGGKSADDAAAAGTTTGLSQVIDLTALGDVDGKPFVLAATLGGYTTQTDNTVMTATWLASDGSTLGQTTIGPDLPASRDGISMQDPYTAAGTVPSGSASVRVALTFTHGSAGHNDASASVPYLAIGDQPSFTADENDYAATCSASETVAPVVGQNLLANPSAEHSTSIAPTTGTGQTQAVVPDCWTSRSGYFAQGVVPIAQADRTTAGVKVTADTAASSGYYRVDDPDTDNGVATADNYQVFYGGTGMKTGSVATLTQTVDLSDLEDEDGNAVTAAGQSYLLKAWLGGYTTQADNAKATVTFTDADGTTLGATQIGPLSSAVRSAYGTPNGTDNTMLLPLWSSGTVPDDATSATVTITMAATKDGNSDGMADDISLVVGGDDTGDSGEAQSYDATGSTYCTDQVTPALDTNLISNPDAEEYVSAVKLGAPGDSTVTVPSCWVSASALAAPNAVAESYAQSTTTYPSDDADRDATSTRVFWGGTNPGGGIAGVATTSTQTIDLAGLGDIDGQSYKLSGLLGGYATQNDNAAVTAAFLDADGNTLTTGSIGPVKAANRGSVSSLVTQGWYGTVPDGAATVVVTITMTAVSSGNDNNGEADNLSLVIGPSTTPTGPILQTLPYDATGGEVSIDPTTGLPLPPAGGLYRPGGVSAADGTVYASNTGDNVLAAMENGSSSVIAGSLSGYGDTGDGGPAVDATLYQPNGTAVDDDGNLYIADTGDNVVREITTDGVIHRIAGTGKAGAGELTGTSVATDTALNGPQAVAVDDDGNVYIADTNNNRVVEVGADGTITAVAGTGKAGYDGDGDVATAGELNSPSGLALDARGNLYIADAANNLIRRVDASTAQLTTVAGDYDLDQSNDGLGGYSGDGGPATSAQLNDPQGVALDGAGDLFIADTFNHAIRQVTSDGTISTIVNSSATAGGESSGTAPTESHLDTPQGVAVDSSTESIYIADTHNSQIAQVVGIAASGSAAGPVEPPDLIPTPGGGVDEEKLKADRAKLAKDRAKLASHRARLTTDRARLTKARAGLAKDRARLATAQRKLTKDRARLTTAKRQLKKATGARRAELRKKVRSLTRTVRADRTRVRSDRRAITADQHRVRADQKAIAADQKAIAGDKKSIAADKQAIADDLAGS
ncbi:MAG: SMP-30/gluconolactonase/LRE family protein [Nocardioides sp.]|uniref:NHL domain-containing protein n=1 Tax=Nocardioides sp. TaxID=35761 RepID=UPI0039E2ACB6